MAKSSTTWKPGQSGNPRGRRPYVDDLRDTLSLTMPECNQRLVELMRNSNPRIALEAIKEIYNRVAGKSVQAVDFVDNTPDDQKPLGILRSKELYNAYVAKQLEDGGKKNGRH